MLIPKALWTLWKTGLGLCDLSSGSPFMDWLLGLHTALAQDPGARSQHGADSCPASTEL